jgi:hypothetical protein
MTRITPLVGCAAFALFLMACPPTAPKGIEYCDSAAARIVTLCSITPSARVAIACRAALEDGRDWHPKQIVSAQTCDEIEQIVSGK